MPSAKPARLSSTASAMRAGPACRRLMMMAGARAATWSGRPCSNCSPTSKPGKVDVVVVYKIDRLTRSLADFAKIVEIFDAKGVSFVSVTQQFNTTTSMGRLTLNVLLSFAQFEREVTGERIRDKIAASKKKGMWMGGVPPLGYAVRERKLIIVEREAEIVRHIFRRYAALGSVRLLKQELEAHGITGKSWTSASGRRWGGKPLGRGALYLMLQQPDLPRRDRPPGSDLPRRARSDHRPGAVGRRAGPPCRERGRARRRYSGEEPEPARRLAVRQLGPAHDPDPCGQERQALPLLRLALADHRSAGRCRRWAAAPGGGDRADRHRPHPPIAVGARKPLRDSQGSR